MRIAIDAMGGDHAPEQIVQGALEAASLVKGELLLVGDPSRLSSIVKVLPSNVHIHPASQVIEMDEKPTEAYRKKKDSSLVVCATLVKDGQADAMVSAGNTGAAAAVALLSWRMIPGVKRPAIATVFPNQNGRLLLLDAGASPDADPDQMVDFALMGRIYAEKVMGKVNPIVHLLNIGEEPGKGNAWAKQAFSILASHPWFGGNIEGKDLFRKPTDVVVCDAFVGNIVLKTAEGAAEFIMAEIRDAIPTGLGRLLFLPLRKALAPLRKKVDYAEYGGSPLLGVNGICVIGHGRSNAKAIKNAILNAASAVDGDIVGTIREKFCPPHEEMK